MNIRDMKSDDWEAVKRIYIEGILTKNATFEQQAPDWKIWNLNHRPDCRIIAEINDKVVGWAALSNVSGRCVYSGVCEVSIYVSKNCSGKGVGSKLLEELIIESEKKNIWTLQAGIFPENLASIKLHKKFGFREIGKREKIGKMDNNWRDVILLERRSKIIGID